ncbi:plastocyanin/azurin family copper-binding protein [Halorussus halophilus]|uniref:plastocyanin/azurin family copper-binding protein n=1 Tax=Halorussus halophilus TaxID=2650975 RepID=UPI0013017355|nr:plastocyanin/azurin family copper-binding protein [Halorussus halophilus]
MKRRDFLMAASGVAGGTAAGAAPAGAQETTTSPGNSTASGNTTTAANGTASGNTTAPNGTAGGNQSAPQSGGGGGPTETVAVGPGGSLKFEPAELTIAPGTTVKWVWEGDNHNVVPESQPDGAGWEGTAGGASKTYNTGHEYSFTFQQTGEYSYFCQPHKTAGMTGTITVQEGGASSGGGHAEQDPEHMGVPFQAHYVGIATLLMMVVSLVYTFFTLKYGESPHTSGSNR